MRPLQGYKLNKLDKIEGVSKNNPTWIDNLPTKDTESKSFITNWLNGRGSILTDNIKTFDSIHNPSVPLDYSNERLQSELNRQFSTMNKSSIGVNNSMANNEYGKYDKEKFSISVNSKLKNEDLFDRTIVHERTHSLKPYPQRAAIGKLIDQSRFIQSDDSNDKYMDDPDEIYSRLMTFRKANNLKPDQVVTKEDIKSWRSLLKKDQLDRYPTNFLLQLFNTIAQNKLMENTIGINPKNSFINLLT